MSSVNFAIPEAKVLNRESKIVIEGLSLLNGQTLPLTGESTAQGGVGIGGQIAGASWMSRDIATTEARFWLGGAVVAADMV